MTKLRTLKKELKKHKAWKQYKHMFKHPQMKLVYSKIVMVFNEHIAVEQLLTKEFEMLKTSKKDKEKMFVSVFKDMEKMTNQKADWESFAKFLFYAFQTSTYWKDEKKHVENVYNHDNYIKMNEVKRKYFYNWLHSIDSKTVDYNAKIMATMQKVL